MSELLTWESIGGTWRAATAGLMGVGNTKQEAIDDLYRCHPTISRSMSDEIKKLLARIEELEGMTESFRQLEEKLRAELIKKPFSDLSRSNLERELLTVKLENGELRHALELVLPLAKGYAAEHPCGSNAVYIQEAERVISGAVTIKEEVRDDE